MSTPEKEPAEALSIRARPRAVTRLNRKVIAALLLIAGLVIALTFAWGMKRPTHKPSDAIPDAPETERVARAEGLAALPKDYSGVPKLGAPAGEFGRPILKAEREAGIPELPERPDFHPDPEEQMLRARRLKQENEEEEAAKAAVIAHLQTRGKNASPPAQRDREGAHTSDTDILKTLGAMSTPVAVAPDDVNKQQSKQAFIDKGVDAKIYTLSTLQTPRSPHQLMAGSVISAALVTGIRSDLPGQVIASVTENVYDTVTGEELLIPQGARILGQYDSQVAYGQTRVLLVWTRLIMPDGTSLVLDRLPASDTEGYAGLEDRVDWHWRRIFAGAVLSTLIGATAEMAAPDRNSESNVIVATREGLQDSINQVGQEITRRSLDIQPTLTERPGMPVRIVVNKDLILRPYGKGGAS